MRKKRSFAKLCATMLHARRTIEHSNSVFCLFNLSLLSPGIWPSTSRRTSSTTWSRPSFRKSLVEAHLDSNCKGFGTNYGHVMLCDLTLHKAPLEDVEKLVVQLHRLNHDLVPLLGCIGACVGFHVPAASPVVIALECDV